MNCPKCTTGYLTFTDDEWDCINCGYTIDSKPDRINTNGESPFSIRLTGNPHSGIARIARSNPMYRYI